VTALACAAAVAAVLLALRPPAAVPAARSSEAARPVSPPGRARRSLRRWVVAAAAGCGGWVVVGGVPGAVAGAVVAAIAAVVLAHAEPAVVRREREEAAREFPHLVALLSATLRAGAAPLDGLATVTAALPGAAARRVEPLLAGARFGGSLGSLDPAGQALADDEVLAPLVRTLARAERSGSSIVEAVERLADELEAEAGAAAEDAARQVGVAAAVPLGVCLLPAFLLIGIVPTVAGLLSTVTR
jgi:pilus assembly protein TadC